MTENKNRQVVATFKGKGDLAFGIICFIIGILFARGGLALAFDGSGGSIVTFGIFWAVSGIVCLIHYGAKAPKVLYSDGTTGTLKR